LRKKYPVPLSYPVSWGHILQRLMMNGAGSVLIFRTYGKVATFYPIFYKYSVPTAR